MFISYDKIDESLAGRGLTRAHYQLINKATWVVTEKIHGAHFYIIMNAGSISYAKRKVVLTPEDDFFGYQHTVDPLRQTLLALEGDLRQRGLARAEDTILLYGELCGGGYPHPDVEPNLHVDLVQTGVYYSPDVEFCLFDIAIVENNDMAAAHFLDYQLVSDVCEQAGLLCAGILFMGSYHEAMRFDIHFESTLPSRLGLPRLPFPNKAEGVVIKPCEHLQITTDKATFRPVLKMKIDAFSEVQFHQSEKWNDFEPRGSVTHLIRDLLRLVNQNRLMNAASKIGRIKPGDKEKCIQLRQYLLEDIADQIRQHFTPAMNKLTSTERETVERHLHAATDELLKEYS